MKFVVWFDQLDMNDVARVGGKNASLGFMIHTLKKEGINIPNGFATNADAYWRFIDANNLREPIAKLMNLITDVSATRTVTAVSKKVRCLIESQPIPEDIKAELLYAYTQLPQGVETVVAVRSSATAEDLPTASFAGQQDSFLNISGEHALLNAWRRCVSSLFTPRAIVYRLQMGFDYTKIALSVGVHHMIPAYSAGVTFTLDPQTGFKDVVFISANYGFGESVVKGLVNADEFYVHKPTLHEEYASILSSRCGAKKKKVVCARSGGMRTVLVPVTARARFCLSQQDILQLARLSCVIEQAYSRANQRWMPMDIEWVKSAHDGLLYIVQARPETAHSTHEHQVLKVWTLTDRRAARAHELVHGQAVGQQIVQGRVRVIKSMKDGVRMQDGDILVASMTDPDWVTVMKKAGAIITDQGGRTCHAAIVSRELGVPAIVGTLNATECLKTGQLVTVDCSQGEVGYVYAGKQPFDYQVFKSKQLPDSPVPFYLNVADPQRVFSLSWLPVAGVGLARMEFIISSTLRVHPLSILYPQKTDAHTRKLLASLAAPYKSVKQFFVQTLAQEIATIAAAFWPKPVIVRFSDFKSNEYGNLAGGKFFEPQEQNPMLGMRGAARYESAQYTPAFALECQAIMCARNIKGFKNIQVMVPFIRTVPEAASVIKLLKKNGLVRDQDDLKIIMMLEVPANIFVIDKLSKFFDGFSIGSNDLTQLMLGVDRDNAYVAPLFNEQDTAVKQAVNIAIDQAHVHKRSIGICGQAPSDYPEFARWLIAHKIDYLSLSPDAVMQLLMLKRVLLRAR